MAAYIPGQYNERQQINEHIREKLHMLGRVCFTMLKILRLQSYDIRDDYVFKYLSGRTELTGRGYDEYEVLENATPEMFIDMYISLIGRQSIEDLLSRTYRKPQIYGNVEECWVYYISPGENDTGNITVDTLKPFSAEYEKSGSNFETIFLVSPRKLQPQALATIVDIRSIQIRYMENMLYDVSSHSLQPLVRILTEPEIASLAATSGITFDKLPRITESDPLMRDYGAKSGNVVHVLSISGVQEELSDMNISYLAVINDWASKT